MVSKLKYGNTNTFFVRGINGNLLVDTDYAGTLPAFYRAIKEHNIKISDITYVLATHYHPDHIGLISELMELGVKLLLIDTQVEYIHFSDEIFSRDARMKYVPINKEDAVLVKCKESRVFLHSIGIEGEILSTPSHSKDQHEIHPHRQDKYHNDKAVFVRRIFTQYYCKRKCKQKADNRHDKRHFKT